MTIKTDNCSIHSC